MRGFGLLTTFIVVALTTTVLEARVVQSRTRRHIPTECPTIDPVNTTIHLAHESNCSLFYKCYLGERILYNCPTGLHFNAELQVCDWPENVECTLTGTSESEGTDTENNQDSDDSEHDVESENAEETEAESEGDNVTIIPTECPAENGDYAVHIAHETDCGKYYKCNHGEKIEQQCPSSLEFNAVLQVCDWPENAGCTLSGSSESDDSDDSTVSEETATVAPNDSDNSSDAEDATEADAGSGDAGATESGTVIPTECPAENGDYAVHIAHEKDCGKYYKCNHGEKIEQQCPSGLEFNAGLQVCDWPENAGCTLSGSSDSDDSDDSTDTEENVSVAPGDSDDSSDAEIAPENDGGSGDASATESGTVIPTKCPAENGDDAVHIAHESDCGKYYLCNHGEKIEQQCSGGLEFNAVLQVCDWPENAGCTLSGSSDSDDLDDSSDSKETAPEDSDNSSDAEIAPENNGGSGDASATESGTVIPTECPAENGDYAVHIAHEKDCGKYYKCNHGEKIEQQCPSGLEFNAGLQVCDWPENAGCTLSGSSDSDDSDDSTDTEENVSVAPGDSDDSSDAEIAPENDGGSGDASATESGTVIPTKCPAENGNDAVHIAHESDCGKYYLCNHGEKIEQQCSGGLEFNAVLQVCDWPENAGCTLSGSSDSDDSDDSTDSEETAPEDSDNSSGAEIAPETDGGSGDASATESGTVISTECPAENGDYAVHIAHDTDCGKYYKCNHGEKIEQQCPSGLEFNAVLQVCDWPENAECTLSGSSDSDDSDDSTDTEETVSVAPGDSDDSSDAEIAPENDGESGDASATESGTVIPTKCPAENGDDAVHIAHESDCGKYYLCNHGEKIEQQCSSGLEFNAVLQVCDWPENAGCTLSGSSDSDDSDDSTDSEETAPEDSDNSSDAEIAPETDGGSGDASATESGTVISTECPAENGDYAVHIAHDTDCGKYYKCNHGEKIEQQCPSGLEFNAVLQVCDWPENAECTLSGSSDSDDSDDSTDSKETAPEDSDNSSDAEIAPETDGGSGDANATESGTVISTECPAENGDYAVHIAHDTDCGKYYKCNHGEKIEQQCPSGLEFNAVLQVCDWPENAGCTLSGSSDSDDSDDSTDSEETAPEDSDNSSDAETAPETDGGSGDASATESGTVISTECPAENGDYAVHIAHDTDCGKYYKCNHGEKIEQQCPSGLEFNAVLQVCDWPENAGCTPSGSSDSDDSDDSTDTEETASVAPEDSDNSSDAEIVPETDGGSGDASATESGTVISTECPAENGDYAVHIAHDTDCGKYYKCNHGEKIEQQCPSGLEFNAVLQVCDWPENAGCTLSGSSDSDDSNDSTDSEETAPEDSDNSSDAEIAPETDGGSGDASATESGTVISTKCPAENGDYAVHIAHDTDCGKYYKCNHGEKIEQQCPSGLEFNAVLQVCDWPENAGCTPSGSSDSDDSDDSTDTEETASVAPEDSDNSNDAEIVPETDGGSGDASATESGTVISTECPAENGDYAVHIAHDTDCGKYYKCNHGEKIEQQCPSGLEFNAVLQVCDWPENAGCTLSGSSDSDDSNDSTDSEETAPEDSDNSSDAEIAPETDGGSGDASATESGTVISTECPAENGDYAVHIAHDTDCGKYYKCNHGEKIEQQCPSGLEFNAVLLVCDWPENAGCTLSGSSDSDDSNDSTDSEETAPEDSDNSSDAEIAPETDGGSGDASATESGTVISTECPAENGDYAVHIAHDTDCGKYYKCNHGEKIEQQCPSGLEFNAVLQVCDWPENAECTLSGSSDSDDSDDSTDTEETASVAPEDSDNSNDAEIVPETDGGSGDASATESGTVISTECPAENGDYAVHIAHDTDCGKYYKCNHGEKIEQQCPSGLEFNAVLQVCDWPENAGCTLSGSSDSDDSDDSTDSEETAPEDSDNSSDAEIAPETDGGSGDASATESGTVIPTECPAENGDYAVHIAHDTNCGKYYKCNHGEKIEQQCPSGLEFNAVLQVCDWPEFSGCVASESATEITATANDVDDAAISSSATNSTESVTQGTPSTGDCDLAESDNVCPITDPMHTSILFAHSDAHKFCMCSNGVAYVHDCPAGLVFNDNLKVCDWPASA